MINLGLIMLTFCVFVAFQVHLWYMAGVAGMFVVSHFLYMGRWRSPDYEKDSTKARWASLCWPFFLVMAPYLLVKEERERRERIVQSVLEE